MPLETTSHISGLVSSNPASSDGLNQADDHMRLIKAVLLTDVGDAMTSKSLTTVDGTSIAPSIGFKADATTGLYRKGTGNLAAVGRLTGQGTVEIGSVIMHAAASAPNGYLVCDGQAVSRTTYVELFAVIGTTWGVGDGSTTFNVPGLNSRFPRHREVAGRAGAVGTLQADVFKTHTHTFSGTTGTESVGHTHAIALTTGTMNSNTSHSHNYLAPSLGVGTGSTPNYFNSGAGTSTATSSTNIDHTHPVNGNTGGASASHTHSITGTSDATGDATETRPLSASLLFCIRAL